MIAVRDWGRSEFLITLCPAFAELFLSRRRRHTSTEAFSAQRLRAYFNAVKCAVQGPWPLYGAPQTQAGCRAGPEMCQSRHRPIGLQTAPRLLGRRRSSLFGNRDMDLRRQRLELIRAVCDGLGLVQAAAAMMRSDGNRMRTVVPKPGLLSIARLPPCNSTSRLANGRPRPVPVN
jgi:hypothetical protein